MIYRDLYRASNRPKLHWGFNGCRPVDWPPTSYAVLAFVTMADAVGSVKGHPGLYVLRKHRYGIPALVASRTTYSLRKL